MNSPSLLLAGVMGLGGSELLIIFAIIMLLFGATKLPNLARGLGQSIREFKKAAAEDTPSSPAVEPKKPETTKTPGAN